MGFVDISGGRLWYADSGGDGTPVVFAHPAAGSSASWKYQLAAFGEYRCITYDLRGWGRSATTQSADAGVMSDDLLQLVDGLWLDRFHLIGAAYGGFGALDFALRFSDRLRSLVLSTTQGGLVEPEYVAARERTVSAAIRGLPVELRELGPSYRLEDPAGVSDWLAIEHAAGQARTRQKTGIDITYKLLEQLALPVLLLAAGADLLAPPALMRLIAGHIPGSEFALIGDAGHSAHWERPAEWDQLVLGFLGRHTRTT